MLGAIQSYSRIEFFLRKYWFILNRWHICMHLLSPSATAASYFLWVQGGWRWPRSRGTKTIVANLELHTRRQWSSHGGGYRDEGGVGGDRRAATKGDFLAYMLLLCGCATLGEEASGNQQPMTEMENWPSGLHMCNISGFISCIWAINLFLVCCRQMPKERRFALMSLWPNWFLSLDFSHGLLFICMCLF